MRNDLELSRRAPVVLLLCALAAAVPASGCFSAHGSDGTETGNPPVIDSKRIALDVSADGARITGRAGAVTPGGATVEIKNLRTGEVKKVTTKADGSFDAQVSGSPDDAFVVTVSSGDKSSAPVYVVRGGAVGGGSDGSLTCRLREQLAGAELTRAAHDADNHCMIDSDCQVVSIEASCYANCESAIVSQAGQAAIEATSKAIDASLCGADTGCMQIAVSCATPPPAATCVAGTCQAASGGSMPTTTPLSCSDREQKAGAAIDAAVAMADTSCMIDSDCIEVTTGVSCHTACGTVVTSQSGKMVIGDAVARANQDFCGNFSADGCSLGVVHCPNMPVGSPACVNGQCTLAPSSTMGPAACPGCLSETLAWGSNGGLVAYQDLSTLAPCVHYMHSRTAMGDPNAMPISCQTDLMACNSTASVGAIETALAHADVQAALKQTSPVLYGRDTRPVDGTVFEIKVGAQVIDVGDPCDGQSGCTDIPAGIQALVDELKSVDQALLMQPQCQAFGASGSCPPDRKLAQACTMCGLGGGCLSSMLTCAKVCSASTDCSGDPNGGFCNTTKQACEAGPCL